MLLVSCGDGEVVSYCGRGDESIGKTDSCLSRNAPGPLGHNPVDRHLAEWSEELGSHVSGRVPREQFSSGDDRIVQSMLSRPQFHRTTQMVDEDIGIDEDVSHGSRYPGMARSRRVRPRTLPPARQSDRCHVAGIARLRAERVQPSSRLQRRPLDRFENATRNRSRSEYARSPYIKCIHQLGRFRWADLPADVSLLQPHVRGGCGRCSLAVGQQAIDLAEDQ